MPTERRLFPRHKLIFSVEIQLDLQQGNQLFTTESCNISEKAIEVSCDERIINTLVAQKRYPHTGRLRFQLPENQYPFDIAAQVVSHRRLAQHQFLLAFIFTEEDLVCKRALSEYF